jgi:SAM-dependent methyltransferase
MQKQDKILLGVTVGAIAANFIGFYFYHDILKRRAFEKATTLCTGKGIINLGASCTRWNPSMSFDKMVCESPLVKVNVDLGDTCPKCTAFDLNNSPLPFSDKQFDVAFGAHILEHLDNWQQALDEWTRIADHVIICIPDPLSLSGWTYWQHAQHFNWKGIDYIRKNWPGISVYY